MDEEYILPHIRINGWCDTCGGLGRATFPHVDAKELRGMARYDFNEEVIRRMVERNHTPEEYWTRTGSGTSLLGSIDCEKCGEVWPCSSIMKLREWKRINA